MTRMQRGRLALWQAHPSWEEAETAWERDKAAAEAIRPLKTIKALPQMPGITADTARGLKWKSFKYMLSHDKEGRIRRYLLKHPIRYALQYIKSLLQKKAYVRDGDFFLYGLPDVEAFKKKLSEKSTLLVVGFSYCQKPHECPSGRFTPHCIHDPTHTVCQQCPIGKAIHALPQEGVVPLLIPTVHYIGEQMLQLVEEHPKKEVLFLITACEMTLEMFADWGNMIGIRGIGARLDGRICNTMRAFELSEEGIKPGLTLALPVTERRILDLIRWRRDHW